MDSHTQGSRCSARNPIEARMSRETVDVPRISRVSQESWLEPQEELRDIIKGWHLHSDTMVT